MPAVNVIELHKGAIEPGINNPITPRTVTNLIPDSEDLTTAQWSNSNTTDTATVLTADAGTHIAKISETIGAGYAVDDTVVASFVGSPGTHDEVWLGDRGNVPIKSATFDLSAGTVIGSESGVQASMQLLPDGQYLCIMKYTRTWAGTVSHIYAFGSSSHTTDHPSAVYAGTETLNLNFHQSTKNTPISRTVTDGYVKTDGAAVTRTFGSTSTKLWKGAVSPAQVMDEAFVSLGTNVIKLWKGAVEPAEIRPTGNEYQAWKGAVEPARVQIDGLTGGYSGLGRGGLGGSGLG